MQAHVRPKDIAYAQKDTLRQSADRTPALRVRSLDEGLCTKGLIPIFSDERVGDGALHKARHAA